MIRLYSNIVLNRSARGHDKARPLSVLCSIRAEFAVSQGVIEDS